MTVRWTLAGLVLVLLLGACSRGGERESATATTATVPVETTATTAATTTTTAPKQGLGVTQRYATDDDAGRANVTVFRYRDGGLLPGYLDEELKKQSLRTVAVEVRVCIAKAPDDMGSVSWEPWSLGDDEGRSYEAWSSYSDDVQARPLYPHVDKATPVGTCRRGWVPFEVPRTAKPTFIEYNTGLGNILKWPLKT